FATISGRYPHVAGADGLGDVLADQLEAGLGMLGTGTVVEAMIDRGSAIDSWRVADGIVRGLVADPQIEPPVVKVSILGPCTLGRRVDPMLEDGRARRQRTRAATELLNV